jgi:hypothetical protein
MLRFFQEHDIEQDIEDLSNKMKQLGLWMVGTSWIFMALPNITANQMGYDLLRYGLFIFSVLEGVDIFIRRANDGGLARNRQ